jgi:antibiotic biosynthesis monooxygenase (ABM) superfamily enzyme
MSSKRHGGAEASADGRITIVTQTRVRPESEKAFAEWQDGISRAIAGVPGFLHQTVLPPSPPAQVDWVILQRFADIDSATAWLRSAERHERVAGVRPMLIGQDDVHLVRDGESRAQPAPVSVVISTRIKPGCEAAYRAWELRIAAAQTKASGFQGYRFEPPIKGIQDDWLSVLRFDSEANLEKWLASPERLQLLEEAKPFTEEFHARVARTGFEQWFQTTASKSEPLPAWKQNLIVLLVLYPVVFLFGAFVQTPVLSNWMGLPFAIALFVGNVVSIIILNYLVPWTSTRFSWWIEPSGPHRMKIDIVGTALVSAICLALVIGFWRLF